MDLSRIFSKTPKGLRARAALIGGLPSHLMKVLTHVDGASRAETILLKFDKLTPQQLSADLTKLEQEGYIRLATVTSDIDDGWALTVNFEPMVVEEYQNEEALEASAQIKKTEQQAKHVQAEKLAAQLQEQQAEAQRLAAQQKADKKAQKLHAKEKIKAETKVKALLEKEQLEKEQLEKELLEKEKIEKQQAEAVLKAQQAEQKAAELASNLASKLAEETRLKTEMKAREAAEQAEADAEASAKERARSEIERISREAEEAQKKSDAELKAKQETERLETLRAAKAAEEARQAAIKAAAALEQERIKVETERLEKQAATEQEKLAKQRQDQEKLEKEKADKEKAHLEIASVLRKAEDDRKNAVERAKAEKLEAKRQAKAEQEASLQAERQAKLEAKAHAKALKLAQQAEEKAKLDASENAKREVARIAKEAEIARAEALQLAKQTADALSLKTKATNEKIESELENTALLHSHTVQVAHAKLAVEEQANIQAKQNAQLEMARIAREADIARQDAAAEMQKNTTDETGKETENKSYFHLDDFDAAEAAEEAAFQAEEQAEAEKKHQPIVSKIDIKIEKTAKQSSEDAGRADIKNAAIAQADIVASMQTNAKSYVSAKKLKLWLANISKLVLIYVPLLALVLLAILHFVNISALIAPIERLASDSTGQPVAIKKVHASLWPQPHFVLEDVAIGNNNIKAVHVLPTASSLFEEVKVVKSLVIEGLNIEQADFNQPLAWASNIRQAKNLKIEQINLKNLTLSIRDLELESFDGKVTLTDAGALNMLALVSSNNALSVTIAPQGDNYEITLKAANWALPFNQKIMFSNLNAKGLASANLLKFSQIDGEIYGGNVTGQANIQWPAGAAKWASSGDFKLTNANAAQLLTTFGSAVEIGGKLTLTANFSNKAITANKLAALSLISGNFDIRQGGINGVELARAVANRGSQSLAGDTTSFDKLTGSVKVNQQQYQFGKLVLASPQFNANGFININANQALTGRVNADLATQSRRLQANFAISGRGKDLKSN